MASEDLAQKTFYLGDDAWWKKNKGEERGGGEWFNSIYNTGDYA